MPLFDTILEEQEEYSRIADHIRRGVTPFNVTGLTDTQKAHLVFSLCQKFARQGLVVTHSELHAKRLYDDLSFFMEDAVVHYPSKEIEYYQVDARSNEYLNERLRVLERLVKEQVTVVMSVDALLQFTIDYEGYVSSFIQFEVGREYDLSALTQQLVAMGYTREDMVEGVGQFALRGGILDVFAPSMDNPCRIEFFGEEADSIRAFDAITQISIEPLTEVTVGAVDEAYGRSGEHPSVLRYIGRDALVFLDEPYRVSERAEGLAWEIEETVRTLLEKEVIDHAEESYIHPFPETLSTLLTRQCIGLYNLPHSCKEYTPRASENLTVANTNTYSGNMDFLADDLQEWVEKGFRVVILAGNAQKCENLQTLLNDRGFVCSVVDRGAAAPLAPRTISILEGSLTRGFAYPLIQFVLLSGDEIFGRSRKAKKGTKREAASAIRSFTDLSVGDYVVHNTHGIGQYVGIDTLTVDAVHKDYLKIKYAGEDYLYVPTDQLDLLHKYIGKEGGVRLSKMGGADFARQKARVKKSVADLARYLIDLYAKRQQAEGFAFSPDTQWQKEFEDKFPYTETEDQLRAIAEMKQDMESIRPMDRLLCGDVGYGKTEVALRGAFKAVMDGKQVAFLAPTTVLCMQHYSTFLQRFRDYPIRVEMLSRFRTPKEQERVIAGLASGEVDVVVGTHKLLGKNIQFKDLGLLVVDEEQRFGVAHKERLKEMKHNVDVLTLSATPIPRTLHMAMVSIRDMSVLTQPPEDRYPVQTYVLEHNPAILADAIRKELARDGQVYYLHNRVQSMDATVRRLKNLLPEANIRFAHGQMDENELEEIMMETLNGEVDVLVCTTIIETGLDIPNVNTIIIENADHMGLAQLYQLKGRVGRSNRRAFAYLTYRPDRVMNEDAVKRLQAIREFTEFGSGFKIAMRDLEIRGAGNILGAQQHGHMDTVGYDMYCQILAETVGEMQGMPVETVWEPVIDIQLDAFIPPDYIHNHTMRIDIYKKIAAITDEADYSDVLDEMVDRFGDPPRCVVNLLEVAMIKSLAKACNISEITSGSRGVLLYLRQSYDMRLLAELIGQTGGKLLFSPAEKPYLTLQTKETGVALTDNIKKILNLYKQLQISEQ